MENIRPRLNTAGIHRRQHVNNDNSFMLHTVKQIIVCVIITAGIFTVSKINSPVCKNMINSIDNTLAYTVDYKATTMDLFEKTKKLTELINQKSTKTDVVTEENPDAQTD